MKKLLLTAFAITAAFASSFAQHCAGGDGPNVCVPQGTAGGPGFENAFNVPCAERGIAYDYNIQFTMFDIFEYLGTQQVDSIEFVAISNLPCGLCWAVDQTDKRYLANEDGCLRIQGTTTDVAGQYELNLQLIAWINGDAQTPSTQVPVPASLTKQAGIRLFLRVKPDGAACAALDTAQNATYQSANPNNCTVGINDVVSEVSGLQIVPNPVSNIANVSFMAEKAAVYTLTVTDMTGKAVAVKQVEVNAGGNATTIERNNLPAGVYFLMVNDGKTNVTRRFIVAD